jgi:GntR family transcriptional regulator/GntR family frlABCD operon transcriptional regulator
MLEQPRYKKVYDSLKDQILKDVYQKGDLLPSENELCQVFGINRSTVRQALGELEKEGYIEKKQGKGSLVKNKKRLGLLSVKGFSEVLSRKKIKVTTRPLQGPVLTTWPESFFYALGGLEKKAGCIYLERLRIAGNEPVMFERTYIPNLNLPRFTKKPLENGSLFETLRARYQVEIVNLYQDIRAIKASGELPGLLKVKGGDPVLHISRQYDTNREQLHVYSFLVCNTNNYSISNEFE